MNHCLSFFACLMSAVVGVSSSYAATAPQNIQSLWKDYSEAQKADRPTKQMDILKRIINISFADRMVWDFNEACHKYIDVATSVNWKDRTHITAKIIDRIEEFDEPILTFVNRDLLSLNDNDSVLEFLKTNRLRLEKACNSAFYAYSNYPFYIEGTIRSDYEYVLWSLLHDYGLSKELKASYVSNLSEVIGERYPEAAYLEYYLLEPQKEALEAFSNKYRAKAIALLSDSRLLTMKKFMLDEQKADSDQYVLLRKECSDYEKLRASFHGKEAEIAATCNDVEFLIERLDSKNISFNLSGRKLSISLRNLPKVLVQLKSSDEKRILWSSNIDNSKGSYYVPDKLQVELPKMDDGNYVLICSAEKIVVKDKFKANSVSLAGRNHGNDGYAIYAAEYDTGKPIEKADVVLIYRGEEIAVAKDFVFNGFTPLQRRMTDLINQDDSYKYLVCRYRDENGYLRQSEELGVYKSDYDDCQVSTTWEECRIMTDRSAFNLGDTLHYKAILYSRCGSSMHTWGNGRRVLAELIDSERNVLAEADLVTNDFGSVSGSFAIPESISKNGAFTIRVSANDKVLGTKRVIVDEFELPDFAISFEPNDKFYFAGDTVVIRGRAESFSGLLMSESQASYSVSSGDYNVGGSLKIEADGSFEFSFASLRRQYAVYNINVHIVDSTGETHQHSTYRTISSLFRIEADLVNRASGTVKMKYPDYEEDDNFSPYFYEPDVENVSYLLDGENACLTLAVRSGYDNPSVVVPCDLTYKVKFRDEVILSDKVASGSKLVLDLSSYPSGLYTLEVEANCQSLEGEGKLEYSANLIKVSKADDALDIENVKYLFKEYGKDSINLQFASTTAPVWAVCELYDDKGNVLKSDMIHLQGECGKVGSLKFIEYEYDESYSDVVVLKVFYFRDSYFAEHTVKYVRPRMVMDFPCEFTRFSNSLYPGTQEQFCIKTWPGTETTVTVFEKSSEHIYPNQWNTIYRNSIEINDVDISCEFGGIVAQGSFEHHFSEKYCNDFMAPVYGSAAYEPAHKKGLALRGNRDDASALVESVEEESADDVVVRSDFQSTLAFLSHLEADEDGNVTFSFTTSDKLSTYYVQAFVHDREVNTATTRQELFVSLPCQVAVSVPRFLYEGDIYNLKATVSNTSAQKLDGVLKLSLYDGVNYKDLQPMTVMSHQLVVDSNQSASKEFCINVTELKSVLGLKITYTFDADGTTASDGMFVTVPVKPASQVLTEVHSAVCLPGSDREAMEAELLGRFVNVSKDSVTTRYVSLEQMVKEALNEQVSVDGEDILSLLDAYHAIVVSSCHGGSDRSELREELISKIGRCLNSDGGFSWYPGMHSSTFITAVVLDKVAQLSRYNAGLFDRETLSKAVQFVDRKQFDQKREWGGLSLEQYLYVRSLYPNEPFLVRPDSKDFKKFSKDAQEYLFPAKDRTEYAGMILQKSRRAHTLLNLFGSDRTLARAWKLKGRYPAILRSVASDVSSLSEYAAEHRDGAVYFPNAVMPFRGLLENELYAHTMLCRLFDRISQIRSLDEYSQLRGLDLDRLAHITDGVRLWIMLQKETQQWNDDPDFMEAAALVISGSSDLLSSEIIVKEGRFVKPFEQIKKSGNGFTIDRKFYHTKADGSKAEEVRDGEVLIAGEKIVAEYKVWNAENRSFVRLTLPRPALLTPCNQVSGYLGAGLRSFTIPGFFMIYPQAYRNVKADRTELSFDVLAEEDIVLTEEFYVTQTGRFAMPSASVESLYARHYRANEGARSPMTAR